MASRARLLQPEPAASFEFNVCKRQSAAMRLRLATIALLIGWVGCILPAAAADDQNSQKILWPTKAWPVSTPEEQGMDSASLARLIEAVGGHKQDSLMIIRHGNIVAEAYYAPYVAGISHDLRSVTKSIVSTLTAIELQHGLLDSVDHPVLDLFSDKNISARASPRWLGRARFSFRVL
jgi:CubicO group peptidase (beta-lactamase class C family)